METDISLISSNRKIIIDTKFYTDTFTYNYNVEKLRSPHLYQIFSYLHNVAKLGGVNESCEGVLMYPMTGRAVSEEFMFGKHKLSIKAINLNQEWNCIRDDLLGIVL
jgi:5-methylcytosine-specific restriction enzyme subunit McrC